MDTVPSGLPIDAIRQELLYAMQTRNVILLSAPAGSGKSTQVPQILHNAGWRQIVVTQPRGAAVIQIAERVRVEGAYGQKVGHALGIDEIQAAAEICFVTDAVLLREMLDDPLLSRYNVIMVDEAHERSKDTDLLLGLLKKILQVRSLKIIVSSATLSIQHFLDYFEGFDPAVIKAETRQFPLEVYYLDTPTADYLKAMVKTIQDVLVCLTGDVLAFVPGREEVEDVIQLLAESGVSGLYALHSGVDFQKLMIPGERRVIVSTSIAETSVTIPGVTIVVDCGFTKQRMYDPRIKGDVLTTVPCSRAALDQRAGRAARTAKGYCFRLFTPTHIHPAFTIPEMSCTDMTPTLVQLKGLKVDNVSRFDFLTSPPSILVVQAVEKLVALGALEKGQISSLGEQMSRLPVSMAMAKALLASSQFKCSEEVLTIAAMSICPPIFQSPEHRSIDRKVVDLEKRKFAAEEGDHLTHLNVYTAFLKSNKSQSWAGRHRLSYGALTKAVQVRQRLALQFRSMGFTIQSSKNAESILRCLTAGFFAQAATVSLTGQYTIISGLPVHVHPSSIMFFRQPQSRYIIYEQSLETDRVYIKNISVIQKSWLLESAPGYYSIQP